MPTSCRHAYVSKNLYVKTRESGPLGGAPAVSPDPPISAISRLKRRYQWLHLNGCSLFLDLDCDDFHHKIKESTLYHAKAKSEFIKYWCRFNKKNWTRFNRIWKSRGNSDYFEVRNNRLETVSHRPVLFVSKTLFPPISQTKIYLFRQKKNTQRPHSRLKSVTKQHFPDELHLTSSRCLVRQLVSFSFTAFCFLSTLLCSVAHRTCCRRASCVGRTGNYWQTRLEG